MCVTSILKPIIGHHFDQKMARITISINNGKFNCLSNNRKFSCTGKTIYGQKNFLCLDCHQIRCNAHCTCRLHVVLRNGLFIQKVISHHLALRPWRQLNKTLGPKAERKQQLGAKRGNARKDFARVLPPRLRLLVFAVQHPSEKNFVQRMIINLTPPCHHATGKYRIKFKAAWRSGLGINSSLCFTIHARTKTGA